MRKSTKEEWLAKAIKTHGYKYDYSKVEYNGNKEKVCIICPEHGEFWQRAANHITSHGHGCPKCGKNVLLTQEEFVERSSKVHNNKYDYSKTIYTKVNKKVDIICPKHGLFSQIANGHLRGEGCPKCANEKRGDSQRLTNQIFIERAKKIHGDKYDYSKVEYKNNRTKVTIICLKHNIEFQQLPLKHLSGQGCPKCSTRQKLTQEEFIKEATKVHKGIYTYDKFVYVDKKTKGIIYCPKHNIEFQQAPCKHLIGQGCPKCRYEKSSKSKTHSIEWFLKKAKEIHGYKYDYSKSKYIGSHEKICIICHEKDENGVEHGEFWQTPDNHLHKTLKQGCPKCGLKNQGLISRMSFNDFIDKANKVHNNKYKYLEEGYTKASEFVNIVCEQHGVFKQKGTNHLCGQGCPKCSNQMSIAEEEIIDFLQKTISNVTIERRNRKIIKPYELDIFIPQYNIAIEYDGLIWHCEKYNDNNKLHLYKTECCLKHGIKLIHIFEDEWLNKQNIIKSRIKNILGLSQKRIYARQCILKQIQMNEAKNFLEDNHIQEHVNGSNYYGLYYNDELVSVMTFGKLRKNLGRNNEEDSYELLRFCNKLNTTVVGGASKLLKHFIKEVKPKKIISYADRRWSNGNLYKTLGFTHTHNSKPNYFYVSKNGKKRENRFKYRKSELIKQGFDKNKSEHQIMLEQQMYRIYDCGTMVFEMNF